MMMLGRNRTPWVWVAVGVGVVLIVGVLPTLNRSVQELPEESRHGEPHAHARPPANQAMGKVQVFAEAEEEDAAPAAHVVAGGGGGGDGGARGGAIVQLAAGSWGVIRIR